MSNEETSTDFRVGPVAVRPDRLQLEIDGTTERVEPRVMEILVLLAERSDTVSREELRDELWDAYVTDDAIHRAVWKLRRALGEHADLVETVPKRGYRLTRPPVPLAPPPAPEPTPATTALRRIAGVLVTAALAAAAIWITARDVPTPAVTPDLPDAEFVPLTSLPGYESAPDMDDSGELLVFANFPKEGPTAFEWDLWLRRMPDGEQRRLTDTPEDEMSPALSPDGTRLAFLRMGDATCGFFVRDLNTGDERALGLDCGVSRGPSDCCRAIDWRNDETLLVTRRETRAEPVRLYELPAGGTGLRTVSDPPAQSDGDVDFAPAHDGHRVAMVRRRTPEISDLFVLDLESGDLQRLTHAGYPINGVAWSDDDRYLVFALDRTGTSSLWQIDARGGDARPLRTVGMNASRPALQGDRVVYEEWKSEINVWEADLRDGTARPLVQSTRWDWRGVPSPDGTRLAFVSNRDGAPELWIARRSGADARRLTRLERQVASAPSWSPGSDLIAIAVAGEASLDIVAVDPASGQVTPLVEDASDEREPVFSRAGDRLFFASNRTGEWEIWSIDLPDGAPARWTRGGGISAREALSGPGIWFVRPGEPGLWRQVKPGHAAEQAVAAFAPTGPADWLTLNDGNAEAILFARRDANFDSWLSRLDPTTGAVEDLTLIARTGGVTELFGGAGLWASPDLRSVIVSSIDLSHSDLWLRHPAR